MLKSQMCYYPAGVHIQTRICVCEGEKSFPQFHSGTCNHPSEGRNKIYSDTRNNPNFCISYTCLVFFFNKRVLSSLGLRHEKLFKSLGGSGVRMIALHTGYVPLQALDDLVGAYQSLDTGLFIDRAVSRYISRTIQQSERLNHSPGNTNPSYLDFLF